MKKIAIMLLAALMLFAFVACDNTTEKPEDGSATYGWVSEADAEKKTVEEGSWYDKKTTDGFEDTQASWQMVLAVTNGATVREDLKTKPVWRIEITDTDTDKVTVYTVNLKSVIDEAAKN